MNITPEIVEALWREAEALREPMVDFTRRLVQTPSLPGQEATVARIVADEMGQLGYDDVSMDEAGNVVGRLFANSPEAVSGKRIMFNTHMDHVDVGDESKWPYPPYEAVVRDGEIWGRGTSDLKGSLACHIYMGALLKRLEIPRRNDIYVAGVVLEELGGLGSMFLSDRLPVDYIIIGEPSENRLAIGHRGRYEVHVTVTGKSVHASVPNSGINPLYSMAHFLGEVEQMHFTTDPRYPALGPTSIAPTIFTTDQSSPNVVPGECHMILDVRNTPADVPNLMLERIEPVLQGSLRGGATGTAHVPPVTLTSFTGLTRTFSGHGAFALAPDSPLVSQCRALLDAATRQEVPVQMWRFATDAGHFIERGMQVIGYGPGYESVIHTIEERISIDMMVEGMVGNAALALGLS
ncbi:MAG TPA: M20/M25/M40 family metallo-hydrolase [Chloroflexia bacterium]|nr:M20/M25/M40 family metallo-hydrolase [Chloroflexia bacterium]